MSISLAGRVSCRDSILWASDNIGSSSKPPALPPGTKQRTEGMGVIEAPGRSEARLTAAPLQNPSRVVGEQTQLCNQRDNPQRPPIQGHRYISANLSRRGALA